MMLINLAPLERMFYLVKNLFAIEKDSPVGAAALVHIDL
jgi:hypothetical protein